MFRLLLLPVLAGCAPSGIWMLTIPYVEGDESGEDACDSTFDENFQDGYQPNADPGTDNSEWTITESYRGGRIRSCSSTPSRSAAAVRY